jgi:hypothetical protein
MGNDSTNLIGAVPGFGGAVLSPVNEAEPAVRAVVERYQSAQFEFVFDPQLYFPQNSNRGQLRTWSYFPSDFETADLGQPSWWDGRLDDIAATVQRIGARAVCSPAIIPGVFQDSYYELMRRNADVLTLRCAPNGVRVLQTVIVRLAELATPARVMEVASLASSTKAVGVYLILLTDTRPREELRQEEQLKGAMKLVRVFEDSGLPVLVSCASSDVVLWKAAGASACATGKFHNLRRFTAGRFNDDDAGGRQMPYWFEEALLAFIRQSDLARVQPLGIGTTPTNPFAQQILQQLSQSPDQAWVALGWRQYLHWFAEIEQRLATGHADPRALIQAAEQNWALLEEKPVFMEEPTNDRRWLRPWLRAVVEFNQ